MADDLRHRYAEALARWALMYPISAWALSEGPRAERLARNWGDVASKFAMEVRDEELEACRERAETADKVLARHRRDIQTRIDSLLAMRDGLSPEHPQWSVYNFAACELRAALDDQEAASVPPEEET